MLLFLHLKFLFLIEITQGLDIFIPEERVVVKAHLGIEGDEPFILGDDEGIYLNQRGPLLCQELVEVPGHSNELFGNLWFESEPERHIPAVERLKTHRGINILLDYLFRCPFCNLFDFHPPFKACNKDRAAIGAVNEETQIELFSNVHPFFKEQFLYASSFRTCLVGDKGLSQEFLCEPCDILFLSRKFYSACLPPAAGMDLCLNNDYIRMDLFCILFRLIHRIDSLPLWNRNIVLGKQLLSLELMDIHIKTPLNLNSTAAFKTGPDIIITPAINQQEKWGELFRFAQCKHCSLFFRH